MASNHMKWFSHDVNRSSDTDIISMMHRHGRIGYAWYWMLLETIASQNGNARLTLKPWTLSALAEKFGCKQDEAEEFIYSLIEFELISADTADDGVMSLWNDLIDEDLRKYNDKVESGKKGAAARWNSNANGSANSNANGNTYNTYTQNKDYKDNIEDSSPPKPPNVDNCRYPIEKNIDIPTTDGNWLANVAAVAQTLQEPPEVTRASLIALADHLNAQPDKKFTTDEAPTRVHSLLMHNRTIRKEH